MFFDESDESDEFEAVLPASAEQADSCVLSPIVHIIGGLDNYVVFGKCTIICIDHSFDGSNASGVSGCG